MVNVPAKRVVNYSIEMKISDTTIRMTLEELDSELDSGSDLAKEIVSLVMNSYKPWSVVEQEHGPGSLIPVVPEEELMALNDLIHSRASGRAM